MKDPWIAAMDTRPRVLCQFNVSRMRAPYDDPLFRDFRVWINAVHALAEKSPGFVWRYKGEKTDAGYIQADPAEPLLMGNLSVWERADDLHRFTFSGAHAEMMKGRKKWFEKLSRGV